MTASAAGPGGEPPEAMPSPDPPTLEPADGSPLPDEVLDLLYRSGEPRDLGATARQWLDLVAMGASVPEGFRAAGRGGLGDLLDAMTRGTNVARTDARLRVSGPDRYRLDFSRRQGRIDSTTIVCDGERRWRVFQARPPPCGTTSRSWPSRAGCSAPGYPAARSSPTAAGPPASSA
jgi:hypothetical protein